MAIRRLHSSFGLIVFILTFYLMSHQIEVVQGRFLWDLSSYCINYCSRFGEQMPLIGVCSCHRITSYHRRMTFKDSHTIPKQILPNDNYEQPMDYYV